MKKLVKGIVDFRKNILPGYRATLARLAFGQSPDTLFIACSDSRVAPNWFASTDPGDLFVIRNVGNLVPPCRRAQGLSMEDESAAAAIEFAVLNLGVSDIIVCGHSDCGAMHALIKGRDQLKMPHLQSWLRHGDRSLETFREQNPDTRLAPHNCLSQLNVLQQVAHLRSYPFVQERIAAGTLRVHGWWFELADATVHFYDSNAKAFVVLDNEGSEQILKSLE